MPVEVYQVSGPMIAASLKNRRDELAHYSDVYYAFLAKEVDVPGSAKHEVFEVTHADKNVTVKIYKKNKNGAIAGVPLFSRVFSENETHEVRLYGLEGADSFIVNGQQSSSIKIRLIGSKDSNAYVVNRSVGKRTIIYDDKNAQTSSAQNARKHLSNNKNIFRFDYDSFKYNKSGFRPLLWYTNFDRIYVGVKYKTETQKWRRSPYGAKHEIKLKYSLMQNAVSSSYEGTFPKKISNWDLNLFADFDQVRWRNFYGLGNTNLINDDRNFNRVRSRELLFKPGVSRNLDHHSTVFLNGQFQSYDVLNDTDRVIAKIPTLNTGDVYKAKQFAGAELGYVYQNVDTKVYATKGIAFFAIADGLQNLNTTANQVFHYKGRLEMFQPITKKFGLRLSASAATLTGQPEFYQYNSLGGTNSMRGFQRDRFYGNTAVASQNEIRFLPDVRTRLFNGKLGIFGFYDVGRVWLDDEKSNDWHSGYGGGIVLIPFNKIAFSASYGVSKDDNNLHFDIVKPLF